MTVYRLSTDGVGWVWGGLFYTDQALRRALAIFPGRYQRAMTCRQHHVPTAVYGLSRRDPQPFPAVVHGLPLIAVVHGEFHANIEYRVPGESILIH